MTRIIVPTLATFALLACGCTQQAAVSERIAHRTGNINEVVRTFEVSEQPRPQRLIAAGNWIARDIQDDAIASADNVREFDAWLQRDVKRWNDSQPAYRTKIAQILAGRPENIEPVSIILFW